MTKTSAVTPRMESCEAATVCRTIANTRSRASRPHLIRRSRSKSSPPSGSHVLVGSHRAHVLIVLTRGPARGDHHDLFEGIDIHERSHLDPFVCVHVHLTDALNDADGDTPVSYTHLTLPPIYS